MDHLRPFRALADNPITIWRNGEPWCIEGGHYGDGAGAIFAMPGDPTMMIKLTVSILDEHRYKPTRELAFGSFWRPSSSLILKVGRLFESHGLDCTQGFVNGYARLFAFRRCQKHHGSKTSRLVVECDECREEIKKGNAIAERHAKAKRVAGMLVESELTTIRSICRGQPSNALPTIDERRKQLGLPPLAKR